MPICYQVQIKTHHANGGAALLAAAKHALSIYGGLSHTVETGADGDDTISFGLETVRGDSQSAKIVRIMSWLDSRGSEYSLTIHRFDWDI